MSPAEINGGEINGRDEGRSAIVNGEITAGFSVVGVGWGLRVGLCVGILVFVLHLLHT